MKNLIIIVFAGLLLSCSDSSKELGSGYWLRIEGSKSNEILTHSSNLKGIPPSIIRYNYDNSFIIAEQKPVDNDDVMGYQDIKYGEGRQSLYYWIIIKDSTKVIGPMNKFDYKITKNKYGVPNSLELKPIY